jgi:hypothetical protein
LLFSFTRKGTQSLSGAVGAWALAIGGYIAASAANPSAVQPDSAIFAIKATIGLLPALVALIAMIIFIKYQLNDERFKQIRDETEARKLAAIKATTRTRRTSSRRATLCNLPTKRSPDSPDGGSSERYGRTRHILVAPTWGRQADLMASTAEASNRSIGEPHNRATRTAGLDG